MLKSLFYNMIPDFIKFTIEMKCHKVKTVLWSLDPFGTQPRIATIYTLSSRKLVQIFVWAQKGEDDCLTLVNKSS